MKTKVIVYILKAACFGLVCFALYAIARGIIDNMHEINRIIDMLANFIKVYWGYAFLAGVAMIIRKDIVRLIEKLNNK